MTAPEVAGGSVRARIGIVSWNTANLLERCLAALPAAVDGLDAEVVVVDNDSSDGSAAVASNFPFAVLERSPRNTGYAVGMNRALGGTHAPYLIAINPDTEPPPRSLTRLVQLLEARPEAGLVAPRLAYEDGSLQHSVYRFPSLLLAAAVNLLPRRLQLRSALASRLWIEGGAPHDTAGEIDWAIGAVHCIRRGALGGQPPYRTRWFMYVEDLDLCWRLQQAGWKVRFEPAVTVPHVANASGGQAWGSQRAARYMRASYDWYGLERGRTEARVYAALNLAGAVTKGAVLAAASLTPGPARPTRRYWASELATLLPLHWRALVAGPPPPDQPPA